MKNDKKHIGDLERNFDTQYYKGIPIAQIDRGYGPAKARRFTLNHTNQNVWIPCKHLEVDGTIKDGQNIDYVFFKAKESTLARAGISIQFVVKETEPNE